MSHFIVADYRRQPVWRRALPLLAAAAGVAITARAGFWQLDRAQQKIELQTQIEQRGQLDALDARALPDDPASAAAVHHRRVRATGQWVTGSTVYLDNRQMNGRPGFFVISALRLGDRDGAVLVQRGWVPRHADDRERLMPVPMPAGTVTIEGRVAPPPSRLVELGEAGSGRIRQNLDLPSFSREIGVALKPISVLQTSGDVLAGADDPLKRDWPRPAVDVHKHYGYAVQWFAMCALIVGLTVWFRWLRPRLRAST